MPNAFRYLLAHVSYKQYKQQKEAEALAEQEDAPLDEGEKELLLKDKLRTPATMLQWALMSVAVAVSGSLSGLVGIGAPGWNRFRHFLL